MGNSPQSTQHPSVQIEQRRSTAPLQNVLLRPALQLLGRLVHEATLTLRFRDRADEFVINPGQTENYVLRVHSPRVLWRILRSPDPGFGESYMDGLWELQSGDPGRFLTMVAAGRQRFFGNWAGRIYRTLTYPGKQRFSHDIENSYADVQSHYDLGNDLYAIFLDKDMNYSCAFFADREQSLHAAQQNKLRITTERLQVEPGMKVLDIGCGWGATCRYIAAAKDAQVTGITLAQNQAKLAAAKSEALDNPPRYLIQDYREHAGTYQGHYDRVVSIGMLEHVGKENLRPYFDTVYSLLRPGGRAVIHSIVTPPLPAEERLGSPWLTRYIFPGGYIPAVEEVSAHARDASLTLATSPFIHGSFNYAETLRRWRAAYNQNYHQLDRDRYDERFHRMWQFYFCMCEAMFAGYGCRVAQWVLHK